MRLNKRISHRIVGDFWQIKKNFCQAKKIQNRDIIASGGGYVFVTPKRAFLLRVNVLQTQALHLRIAMPKEKRLESAFKTVML